MPDSKLMQEIEDRYQIEQVLRRYARGVDRLDADLIRSVYHEDATDDHGGFKGKGVDFAQYCVDALRAHAVATMHNMHQVNIDFDGDTAWVEVYFTALHRCERDGNTVLETFGGRYADRFEKRQDEWKIADRTVIYEWSKVETVAQEYPNQVFEQGKRSTTDLTYRR
ncbi:MAG: nuclear transport factor 2 family protein [Pseudomonadota bacterium]